MKLKLILGILLAGLAFSCERDLEYSEPEYSDAGFITSEFRNTSMTSNVDDFITFSDLSINTVDHAWTITEGSYFLRGEITRLDSVLDKFIIPDAGLVSEDQTVHVLFREGGLKTVNLRNTFNDSVAIRLNDTLHATREGDLWVIDTTFVVDVYDTIVPIIDIRQNGVSVPFQDTTDIITVEAGDVLEFVDLSVKDRVDTRTWRVEDNGSVSDSAVFFQFNKLGDFKGLVDLSRGNAGTVNVPSDFERYNIPATFRVIPSSKPFVQSGEIIELEDQTIVVPFNGEFAPFGNQEEFFTVTVNGGANPVTINSVSQDPNDATLLWIKLNETIYNNDVITVAYDGNGTLLSTDTRVPLAFSGAPVTMFEENLFINGSFENNGEGWAARQGTIEFVTGGGDDPEVQDGTFMLKVVAVNGGDGPFVPEINNLALQPGVNYRLKMNVYAVPGGGNSVRSDFLVNDAHVFNIWQSLRPGPADWEGGLPDGGVGAWANTSRDFTVSEETVYGYYLRCNNPGTFYFDNIRLTVVDDRP